MCRFHSPSTPLQYDYQNGKLNELVDIIIEEKASLFVCAVGVPPKHVVDKLHAAGIPVMNVRFFFRFQDGALTQDPPRWSDIPSTSRKRLLWVLI
jgi:hypothetical protein